MNYAVSKYRKKVRGCFIGKCVGGTLGMPYEGNLNVNNVTYYDPVPTAMVANDDLDLQVVVLEILRRRGLPVTTHYLCDLWQKNCQCNPDEYGVANNNTTLGLFSPLSGHYSNKFGSGMGAAIRSELWACLAPADPDLATKLAREDAATDHYGDGVDACLFLTAVESYAFIESDCHKLIAKGLSYITANVRMTSAFTDTIRWWEEEHDAQKVRKLILDTYFVDNWTDVTINLSLILLSWLAGEGDFSKSICTAASLGYDADCTCATLGAILGLIDPDRIEEKWTWPIGEELVLSDSIVGMHESATIGDFCHQIFETCVEIQNFYGSSCKLEGETPAWTGSPAWTRYSDLVSLAPDYAQTMSIAAVTPIVTKLIYPEEVAIMAGKKTTFRLILANTLERTCAGKFELCVPDGFRAEGNAEFNLQPGETKEFPLHVTIRNDHAKRAYYNPMDIRFTIDGLSWSVTCGLVSDVPWLMDGKETEMCSNILTFGSGAHVFEGEFKLFTNRDNERLIVQGTRPIACEIDGALRTEHDDKQYVPAIHRCKDSVLISMKHGWHTVKIEIQEGNNLPGECMFLMGHRYSWRWLTQLEWRLPDKKEI